MSKSISKRVFNILEAVTPSPATQQRVAELASNMNRMVTHQKRTFLASEAVRKLVETLYVEDANVDAETWRILIPLPWGSKGWKHWGIRQWEGRALQAAMINRIDWHSQNGSAPLFLYESQVWLLNLGDYPSLESAQEYAKKYPLGWKEWRAFADKIAKDRHSKQGYHRGRH